MTKKYRLLIDSPVLPRGTEVVRTYVDTAERTGYHYMVRIDNHTFYYPIKSVENNPTAWGLIEESKQSFKKWRAKVGDKYYHVFARNGNVNIACPAENNDSQDEYLYLTGNYFQTEEEAMTYKKLQEAIGRVTHAIIEANEGWEPEWGNVNQKKWYIIKEHAQNTVQEDWSTTWQYHTAFPHIKNKELALSIISSHKEDLDLIFNFKK